MNGFAFEPCDASACCPSFDSRRRNRADDRVTTVAPERHSRNHRSDCEVEPTRSPMTGPVCRSETQPGCYRAFSGWTFSFDSAVLLRRRIQAVEIAANPTVDDAEDRTSNGRDRPPGRATDDDGRPADRWRATTTRPHCRTRLSDAACCRTESDGEPIDEREMHFRCSETTTCHSSTWSTNRNGSESPCSSRMH